MALIKQFAAMFHWPGITTNARKRLLVALALLCMLAQSMAIWHQYSHSLNQQASAALSHKQSQDNAHDCDLCLAAHALHHIASAPAATHWSALTAFFLPASANVTAVVSLADLPYAIRAPPVLTHL